jgi:hypothetical protein
VKQQSKAIQARWAGEREAESELTEYFRSIPVDKGLEVLARMRKNCTLGGTILNERINDQSIQRCFTCKKSIEELNKRPGGFRGWRMSRPRYHPEDRNIKIVDNFCSDICIAMAHQKEQGVRGVPDRGMLPSDNPENHPRQVDVKNLHEKAI